jgi:phosphoserine phosphatase RsbU/P
MINGRIETLIHEQLIDRQQRLEAAITNTVDPSQLRALLQEVDAALDRIEIGTYGICEVCKDPIDTEELIADPLIRFCIDHLTPLQQQALERDLELAARIQNELLPMKDYVLGNWQVSYHYEAAGVVSGDYCDLVSDVEGSLYFMLGDVTGKGVAAAMLMAQLHAMFRTLISIGLSLDQLVERANRLFCESTLPTHYATLVCGRASNSGEVEVCNAGHPPPLWLHGDQVIEIKATGLPVGVFCEQPFSSAKVQLSPGDSLLLYTDGFSEAQDVSGIEYGEERLMNFVTNLHSIPPREVVSSCLDDLRAFRAQMPKVDDLTIMALWLTG